MYDRKVMQHENKLSYYLFNTNEQRILQSDWPRAFWPKSLEPEISQTLGFRK